MMGVTGIKDIVGRVVISKQGRDKDRYFVVLQVVNENYVMIADGDLRKTENPKMKNIKHIQFTNMIADELADALRRGEIPADHVVRKTLKRILEQKTNGEGGLVNG